MIVRSRRNVPEDVAITAQEGWEGMHIWWLIDKEQTGTSGVVLNTVDFPPQKAHEVHRHDNAAEYFYVVRGSGLSMSDGEPVRLNEGDVAIYPPEEWHGFYNDTDEVCEVVTFWTGVDRYADLGYEGLPDWRRTLEGHI